MDEKFTITEYKQYRIMQDAVKNYELLQEAKKENLAGTYWRGLLIDGYTKEEIGYCYYFVERYSFDDSNVFDISIRKNGNHSIESNRGGHTLLWSKKNLKCISAEQFKAETKTVLDKYGLMWKK